MAPTIAGGGQLTSGPLEKALIRDFGSVEEFKKLFNATTAGIQGSGWGWLVSFLFFVFYDSQKLIYVWIRDMKSILGSSRL